MSDMDDFEKKDEEIVSLVQSGKIELFGIVIDRYEKKMKRYASKVLNNHDDIQDVVQEIFTKAYINIKSVDTKRKFSSWLYRIAHNEIVNVFKKNKKRGFSPFFNLDVLFPQQGNGNDNNINKQIEQKEMQQMIEVCFDQLEEKYREPIALYYLEEFSYGEIADIMQIPISTVGVRIKRGKEAMKSIFKKQGYDHR